MKKSLTLALGILFLLFSCTEDEDTNPFDSSSNSIEPLKEVLVTQIHIGKIEVSWEDNYDNETGYQIGKKLGNQAWIEEYGFVNGNTTIFIDSLAEINQNIRYRVSVCHDEEISEPTESSSIYTDFPSPTNLNFEQVNIHTIKLTWWDQSLGEDGFKIEKKVGNGNFEPLTTLGENSTTFTDEDAELNQNIIYRVYGYKGNNSSNPIETITIDNIFPAPSNLNITQNSVGSFTLEWEDNSNGEQGFKIERKIDSSEWSLIGTVGEDIETFEDSSIGKISKSRGYDKVYYRVRGFYGDSYSDYLESESSVDFPSPTNLNFEQVNIHTIKLTWWDQSLGEDGFKIEKKVGDGNFELLNTVGENITTFTDEDAELNQNIIYRVYGYKGNNSSNPTETTTIDNTIPAPSNLIITQNSVDSFTLEWEDESIGEQGFKIERKVGEDSYQLLSTVGENITTFTDEEAGVNETVQYKVYTYSGDYYSLPVESTVISNTIPAPTNLNFEQINIHTIKLTWSDQSLGEDGFKIEKKVGEDNYQLLSTVEENITTFTDEDANINESIQYRVYAYLGNESSDSIQTTIIENTFPAPTNLSFEQINIHTIKLTWSDQSLGEDGFKIEKKVGNGNFELLDTVGENITTFTDEDANINESIQYRVYAYLGNESSASIQTTIIENSFSAPTNLNFQQLDITTIKLNWEYTSFGETGFKIDRKVEGGSWETAVGVTTETSWSDEGMDITKSYEYRVYAYYGEFNSEYLVENYQYQPQNLEIELTNINSSYILNTYIDIDVNIISHDQYSSVESVKFYVDDNLLYTDDTEPYSYSWNSVGFEPNQYTIKVVAIDNFGTSGEDTHQISLVVPDGFLFLEGGTFPMGDHFNEGSPRELPVHDVTLSPFIIGKYEVTQGLYEEVMGSNPSYSVGENRPVEQVSWYDAVESCNKLSEMEGLEKCYSGSGSNITCDFSKNGYRLATEAEWEYVARGGTNHTDNFRYSGCHEESELGDYAWYDANSNNETHEVGTKLPNQLGVYDMSGNVYEWCWDWYDYNYYSISPSENPTGPGSGSYRICRGGSWYRDANNSRIANRVPFKPVNSGKSLGFRLVRSFSD